MDLGSFTICLAVKDIAASKRFYKRLGFSTSSGEEALSWVMMKNGDCAIGLYQGIPTNILTFNPGTDSDGKPLSTFTDVRELQRQLKTAGFTFLQEADESTAGPAGFMMVDPDGNEILVNQLV